MLAGGERSRVDSRVTAMLRAKMRDDKGTREVRVGDISPSGLLLVCDRPPPRGEIVDIDVGGYHIVGEVRWVSGRRCGLRTRERVNVNAVLTGRVPSKRVKAVKPSDEPHEDLHKWPLRNLLIAYGVLGLTAFSTAYLIVNYLIL